MNDDHPINHITKNDDLSLPSLMSKGFLTPFFSKADHAVAVAHENPVLINGIIDVFVPF